MNLISRRSFIQKSALAAGSYALIGGTSSSAKVIGANERLRIAVAGLNGRGKSHISGWLEQPNV
ncbi:MAG: twin-arginine translocation signal domain-containing protein, partial [Verrucomicrobia bacterium]|nr:twin-arginine translocation signal domain-containing protein [Verrucomicrobiota bacterium]